jgi:hypothetical protein
MNMNVLFFFIGLVLVIIVLGDAFETMVLPRRVTRQFRLARIFFRYTWRSWLVMARLIISRKRKETFVGFFGPLSVIVLIILWATGLVFGFALLHWASGSAIEVREGTASFSTYLYLSGTTLFTLGLGDVTPVTPFGRGLIAFEAGLGLGFLALVISYLPLLNQSFASREVTISLFDAHAGSPPTAAEMIRRHVHRNEIDELREHLYEWERWSSELLESHLSYPVLALFRSQHDNQSWLGSLMVILDTCAFVLAGVEGVCKHQAKFTFAMARHTIVDLAQIFNCPPLHPDKDRLPSDELKHLCSLISSTGLKLQELNVLEKELSELRQMYEPYVYSLSRYMRITIPPWFLKSEHADNWQTTPWDTASSLQKKKRIQRVRDEHF